MASDAVRGRFLWHELMTSDTAGAAAFYSALTGWGTMPWMDGSYTLFTMGDVPRAGMMALLPEMKSVGVPPHWLCYFGVPDCDVARRVGSCAQRAVGDCSGRRSSRPGEDGREVPDGRGAMTISPWRMP